MALYELTNAAINEIGQTTFSSHSIGERSDLQRLLKQNVKVIAPEPLLVIAEEFCEWDESKRRIDLLALDQAANLVVIELKRTEDGGHMEFQAIRYAAMVSAITFSKAVEVFADYLKRNGSTDDSQGTILEFLKWEDANERPFGQDVRIILVSAEFSKEITTSVLWLNEHDLDIRCVRLRPYALDGRVLLDVQQIIPLPEATSYMIGIKEKAEENRQIGSDERDLSKYDLTIDGTTLPRLSVRALAFEVVKAALTNGMSAEQISAVLPKRKWISVEGELTPEEFCEKASAQRGKPGAVYDAVGYFYCGAGELFHAAGKTYALSRKWGVKFIPLIDELISKFPPHTISYHKTDDEDEA